MTYNLVSSNRTFTVPATTTIFTTDPGRNFSIHNAVMSGLSLDAEYSYVVGNPSCGYSSPRTFRTQRTSYPQYHVLLGDMGAAFAYSLCKECSSEETCVCAPNATAGMLSVRPHLAGTASGLGGSIMIAGGAALSTLAGAVMEPGGDEMPLLLLMWSSAVGGVGIILYVYRRNRELQPSDQS